MKIVSSHSNFITFCEIQETENSIYIIMELIEGEKLFKTKEKFKMSDIADILA